MTYLDHAATTPMLPVAVARYTEALGRVGNPSSLHTAGRRARREVEEARESIAAAVGALPTEVVLATGGTEADNLAVKGVFWARRAADPRRTGVVVSATEHHAVLDAGEWLAEHEGATLHVLDVDEAGRVDPADLRALLAAHPDEIAVVSVMWANNEVGTVNDVRALADVAHEFGVPLHTDAVQAVGSLPVDFATSGADALSLTGHKLGGPVGVGALLLRRDATCVPLLHGGGQERDVRSGTLDVPALAGLAAATRIAVDRMPQTAARLRALRDDLVRRVCAAVPDAVLNGDALGRLPGNAHFSFPGCEGDSLLLLLDARGVEVSTGSACSAGVARPSHVLTAMGASEDRARGSLRFSLGATSTEADVDALLDALPTVVERARRVPQR
jgi:cysteine desulfurase